MSDSSDEQSGLAPSVPESYVGTSDASSVTSDTSGDVVSASDSMSTGDDVVAAPQGVGSRLSDSFGSILVGLILVPLCCIGLFWNEGHAVHVARALTEAGTTVQPAPTDRRDPALDGRLVYVSGNATSAGGVTDSQLGVRAQALAIAREVEMYQWKETEEGSGNDRKFIYRREWSSSPIVSSRFHSPSGHDNPSFPSFRSRTFGATDAKIDAFPLSAAAAEALRPGDDLAPNDAGVAALQKATGRSVRTSGGTYFVGSDPNTARVGDLRVSYKSAPEGTASFMGQQSSNGLQAFRASNGQEVLLASVGTRTADELVAKGQQENRIMTWVLRAVGMLILFFAFCALFAPVNVLASYVPVLGSLVSGATSLIALAATVLVGGIVIAIAWFAYRPLLAGGIIVGAVAIAFALRMLRGRVPRVAVAPAGAQGAGA